MGSCRMGMRMRMRMKKEMSVPCLHVLILFFSSQFFFVILLLPQLFLFVPSPLPVCPDFSRFHNLSLASHFNRASASQFLLNLLLLSFATFLSLQIQPSQSQSQRGLLFVLFIQFLSLLLLAFFTEREKEREREREILFFQQALRFVAMHEVCVHSSVLLTKDFTERNQRNSKGQKEGNLCTSKGTHASLRDTELAFI